MPDSDICGRWVYRDIELFAGDRVVYVGMTWRVITARRESVLAGFAPIVPEDEECASILGNINVHIRRLARIHEAPLSKAI